MQKRAVFSRFLFIGSLNTVIDFGLFFILADLCAIQPVIASIISSGITMCVSFYLNHTFVFRSAKKRRQTLVQFFAVTLCTVWGAQSAVIALVTHALGTVPLFIKHVWIFKLFAKLCGVVVSFVLNFTIYRYIFHEKEQAMKDTLVT